MWYNLSMVFDWNNEKVQILIKERNISFERIVVAIDEDHLLDILDNPNKEKYSKQVLLIVEVDEYVYVVPCIIEYDVYFMKTIFPSRKYTEQYLPGKRRNK